MNDMPENMPNYIETKNYIKKPKKRINVVGSILIGIFIFVTAFVMLEMLRLHITNSHKSSSGLLYKITSPSSCIIVGIGSYSETELVIPEKIGIFAVTAIEEYAFEKSDIVDVTIPEGVTVIGKGAFSECEKLVSVSIPKGVTVISEELFSGCDMLESIKLPEGITSIGARAFSYCQSLVSVNIPEGVISIGGLAFCGCLSLKSLDFPESLIKIGREAFSSCQAIESVTIDKNITDVGESTFTHCYALTKVVILDGVKSIVPYQFGYCYNLKTIEIPKSVTKIGEFSINTIGITVNYGGTVAEWKALEKDKYWNGYDHSSAYTVICADGTVSRTAPK